MAFFFFLRNTESQLVAMTYPEYTNPEMDIVHDE